jgi:hypothetical protein
MEDAPISATSSDTRDPLHSIVKWSARLAAAAFLLVVLALLNNNYSIGRMSRAEFRQRLDRSIDDATNWLVAHPEMFGNPALMFMVADMEHLSGDVRLRRVLEEYRRSQFVSNQRSTLSHVWPRMVDSQAPVPLVDARGMPTGDIAELLWLAHAIAPDRVLINSSQRANMFSPTKYFWGRRVHQLFALGAYRHYNGSSPELEATLDHLAKKVARDARFDLRVNDTYPQRCAFLLGAGRPDLVRRRWIERVLAYQHGDGHWSYCWFGWCKGIIDFSRQDPDPSYTTVQAAWALYMLKHRFPQWTERHYESR